MSKKQLCLLQRDYKSNCNKNDNDNGKIDHIDEKYIDQDVDIYEYRDYRNKYKEYSVSRKDNIFM